MYFFQLLLRQTRSRAYWLLWVLWLASFHYFCQNFEIWTWLGGELCTLKGAERVPIITVMCIAFPYRTSIKGCAHNILSRVPIWVVWLCLFMALHCQKINLMFQQLLCFCGTDSNLLVAWNFGTARNTLCCPLPIVSLGALGICKVQKALCLWDWFSTPTSGLPLADFSVLSQNTFY